MHALGFPSFSAPRCSRTHLSSTATQGHICCCGLGVTRLFSGLAIFVLLLWCSGNTYGAIFAVTETSVNARNSNGTLKLSDRSALQSRKTGNVVLASALPMISNADMNLAGRRANLLPVSPEAEVMKLLPLVPLGGLPVFPAALLWLPEADDLSDLRMTEASQRSISSKYQRTIRIGMLLLFAMGLLGMLFGCGAQAQKPTAGQYKVTIAAGAANQFIPLNIL